MLLMKVLFNLTYVTAAWILVVFMYKKKNIVGHKERFSIKCIFISFLVLALGETFGRLCSTFEIIAGMQLLVMGISATLFIILLLFAFKYHFNCTIDFFQVILIVMAIVRIITLIFPGDKLEVQGNIIFSLFGLGVALLILREAFQRYEAVFIQTGIMLLLSMLCTIPAMFFHNNAIIIFLFEAARALANLSIGVILLKGLFRRSGINMVRFR